MPIQTMQTMQTMHEQPSQSSCYGKSAQGCTYTASGEYICGFGGGDGTSIILKKPTGGYGDCGGPGLDGKSCTMCGQGSVKK